MSKAKNVDVSLSQKAARELYEMAKAPRIVAFDLSKETREEILGLLKPVEKKAK